MKWFLGAVTALIMVLPGALAEARPMLYDAVALNIGVNCQWQQQCMGKQRNAMKRALYYVETRRPPHSRIQLCNRNASRGRNRVDWIGYENCIRNTSLVTRGRR